MQIAIYKINIYPVNTIHFEPDLNPVTHLLPAEIFFAPFELCIQRGDNNYDSSKLVVDYVT